jgi:hypothetical protein
MIPFICCPVAGRRSAFVTPSRSIVPAVEAVVGTVVEGAARVVDGVSAGVLLGVDSGWGVGDAGVSAGVLLGVDSGWGVGDAGGGCGAVKILV